MKFARHLARFGALALVPAAVGAQAPALPRTHAPRPTTAAITEQDLMTRLYIFADDSMQGRDTGSPGFVKGTEYIAGDLRRLGLVPAGDSGTYFQRVPLVRRTISPATTLVAGGQPLVLGKDFLPLGGRGLPRAFDGAATIFGGAFDDRATTLSSDEMRGRVVVFTVPAGSAPGALRVRPTDAWADAAAVLLVTKQEFTPAARAAARANSVSAPLATLDARSAVPFAFLVTPTAAARIFGADWQSVRPGTAGTALHGAIVFQETPLPVRNVVAVLPGTDPALRGQFVALGAHSDHVGIAPKAVDHDSLRAYNTQAWVARGAYAGTPPLTAEQRATIRVNVDSLRRLRPARPDSIFNGADDDGSGSMALLEVAEALASGPRQPKRSVLFVWHAGEERGLLGSRYFGEHTTVPRDSIVAQVNIDMVGRGATSTDTKGGGPGYVAVIGAGRLSTQLGRRVEEVNRASRAPLAFDFALDADGHPENLYCRSDHYNYARWGIPVVFFFTGLHGDYHQVTDEPQYINYPNYARVTRYVRDLTLRLAADGQRLAVDGEKLDPNGGCRQ